MGSKPPTEPAGCARQAAGLAAGIIALLLVYPGIFFLTLYDYHQGDGVRCRGWGGPLVGGGILAVAAALFAMALRALGWRRRAEAVAVLVAVLVSLGVALFAAGLIVGCETYYVR